MFLYSPLSAMLSSISVTLLLISLTSSEYAKMLAPACSFPLPEALSGPVLELTQVGDLRTYD